MEFRAIIIIMAAALFACSRQNPVNDTAGPVNLARYPNKNAEVAHVAAGEERVVFFGDSITEGWDLAQAFPGRPYINRGISGQNTSQMLRRFRADVVDLNPKVVIILAGTNDIAAGFPLEKIKNNIAAMVEMAGAKGIRVVLASVLPVRDIREDTSLRRPDLIRALNEWMKGLSAEKRLVYLDYFSAMADGDGLLRPELSGDGLHPNAKGYEVMKPLADEAIRKENLQG